MKKKTDYFTFMKQVQFNQGNLKKENKKLHKLFLICVKKKSYKYVDFLYININRVNYNLVFIVYHNKLIRPYSIE